MKPFFSETNGALQQLLEDAQLFQALLEVGQEALPANIRTHLVGVGFDKQTLVLQIDDAIWATQLRFYEPNLLSLYQTHFPHLELNRVKVKVILEPTETRPKREVASYPSDQDAEEMLSLSQHVESDGLRKALQQLSLRAKKKPQ